MLECILSDQGRTKSLNLNKITSKQKDTFMWEKVTFLFINFFFIKMSLKYIILSQ